jgi:transposase
MIPMPSGVQVWLATGHTDMHKGFDGLALLVQETLKRNPHNGHLFVFRGRRGSLIKVLWRQGMCLFAKRLERGRFVWPSTAPREGEQRTANLRYGRMIKAETEKAEIPIKKAAQMVLTMGSASAVGLPTVGAYSDVESAVARCCLCFLSTLVSAPPMK